MSTLSVHDLQGIGSFSNTVRVPSGHTLDVEGRFSIPNYTSATRPSSPSAGEMILNTDNGTLEVWTGAYWAVCGGGNKGTTADNPAASAKEAYDNGVRGTEAYISIAGSGTFLMEFDPTDKFGTGDFGWAKYDAAFFGSNNAAIFHQEYGSPSTIVPAWNNSSSSDTANSTIGNGTHRIGREQSHSGGNSLSTIRIALPKLTKVQYSAAYQAGGSQTADFGAFTQNFNGIVNNSPYEDNGSGYWAVVWDGNSAGNFASNMLICDPGNLGSGNNAHTANTGVLSFGTERGTSSQSPQLIWGTTDAYNEYRYCNSWTLWVH